MIELIDREATVKQICKMGEMLGVGHDRDVTIAVALFVQDDKSAFPTIEIPQWIPCADRLPDKSGRYIVTEKRFAIDDAKHKGRYQTMVEEIGFSNNKWGRAKFFEVTAWMPLPTPYMKEGDQK